MPIRARAERSSPPRAWLDSGTEARRGSSVGQSTALVKRGSGVRIPPTALVPRELRAEAVAVPLRHAVPVAVAPADADDHRRASARVHDDNSPALALDHAHSLAVDEGAHVTQPAADSHGERTRRLA